MLARLNSRELIEWFAFLDLEREAYEEMRDEADAAADTGPDTIGHDPSDPLGLREVPAPGQTLGG